ncbi:peptidoglycan DD-metalloendopeptidase family protein [Alkalihalobacillus oceani]|uniref:Peptidoglycan DD-metalloendopeptidase family protein n=1 Tax=Halalkalibacter oceani TaxID=1653776 RepID=A0A9X2IRB4_9BACI|nr:M23 family metallopeptidase [Halalkalibacter oceani]MCM3716272.1 peptidoglycan DD-metalloendopeptidase family protein [Halalkalibacter oceani]
MIRKHRILGLLFLFCILFPYHTFAQDSSINDIQKQILAAQEAEEEYEEEIKHLHLETELLEEELSIIHNQVREYDMKMEAISKQSHSTQSLIDEQIQLVDRLENELDRKIEARETVLHYFKERARVLYMSEPSYGLLESVLGARSLGDWLHQTMSALRVAQYDHEMIERLGDINQKIKEEKVKYKKELKTLEEGKETLAILEDYYRDLQDEKKDYIIEVQKEITEKMELINDREILKEEAATRQSKLKKELENKKRQVANAQSNLDMSQLEGGTFIMPTTGRFSSGFGPRWGSFHNGIDIANQIGTPIYAAASGRVKWAHYVNGYGNTVLIEHLIDNQTYETLYGHMDQISVRIGDTVSQGDYIGSMGNTGFSTGPHLHFELHVGRWNSGKSNAINPLDLLQGG